jgi:ferrochelatase
VSQPDNGKRRQVAIVLFQLGGPDSPEAIEPFLYNLFSDPDIIDFPLSRIARPALARLMASRRAKRVGGHYAKMGGKSPLRELTERQAKALETELRKTLEARVFIAMRYWRPLTEEAVKEILNGEFTQVILLPLYPQFSRTTTGSSLNEWHRRFDPEAGKRRVPVKVIREFYDHPVYLEAVVERIDEGLAKFSRGTFDQETRLGARKAGEGVHLVFSAHGVPLAVIEAGDHYQAQVEATVERVVRRGGWANPYRLCYQSRVGPGRWLGPMLDETLRGLAAAGARKVLIVPIAFVSDHVETLCEIDIEARALAGRLGYRQFEMMPALNDSPRFIQALADLVLREVGVSAVSQQYP